MTRKGCSLKWTRRNAEVYDCQGHLEGQEIDPTHSFNTIHLNGVVTEHASRATIHRTDGDGGLRGAVRRAITDLGGLRKYIYPTDNVVMKVNIASGFPEHPETHTSPEVIEILADEVAKVCDEQGKQCAKPFFAEANNSWMDIEAQSFLFEEFGYGNLTDRQRRTGKPNIPFIHLTTGKKWEGGTKEPFSEQVEVDFKDPKGFVAEVSAILLDPQTKIISLARAKHHQYTGISLDTKNMYGAYSAGHKSQFHAHEKGVEPIIASAGRVMRPVLTLTDFSPICVGWFGPNFCGSFDDHKIVMSNDLVCGDSVGRDLLGAKKGSIIHLRMNEDRKEGDPLCKLADGSIPLEEAKNPEVTRQAPPEWWFTWQEASQKQAHNLPRWLIQSLGGLTYPISRVLNNVLLATQDGEEG